jgi:hypothetical protein
MEEGAAELAVGHRLEADRLLQRDRLSDAFVLDRAQRIGVDLAARVACAGVLQPRRSQQAADVLGAERGLQ